MISVEKLDDTTYEVSVAGATPTSHRVTLEPEYHRKLAGDRASPEELIRRSFEFLLEREGNTSILPRFELPVIGRYFPEYEQVIREQLGAG